MIKRIGSRIQKLFAPRSLRYQLLTRTLFVLSLILLLIGFLQYLVMKDFLYKNEAETLTAKMMSLPRDIRLETDFHTDVPDRENSGDGNPPPDGPKFLFLQDTSLALISPDGTYTDLLGSNGLSAPRISKNDYTKVQKDFSLHRQVVYKLAINKEGTEQLIVFRPERGTPRSAETDRSGRSILQIGTDTAPMRKVLLQQLFTFIVLSALALAGGLALYLPLLRKTLVPLSKIVNAVQKTNAGNLAERFPIEQGQEEIDRLSETFNNMLMRLEDSFEYEKATKEQMRRFIADASHELRTPLTSIHGFLEVLLRGAANRPEQLYNALNSMHGESKRIIKLVEDLLLLAKMDREPGLHLTETRLADLMREMEPQLKMLAGGRTVLFDLTKAVKGNYDTDKMKQVILNLFQNAVQHTDPVLGEIRISLIAIGNQGELSVRDNGPGIDKEKIPYIWDRFYRMETSRTRQNGGAGLGLSITKTIVEAHNGKVKVDSQAGQGSTFLIDLPLSEAQ